ncbi:TVP38/TMEM64 family protein [Williamsia deligens]|uniref:TVP38/TMEM64 family membrane protein n=1 Tax=Williamsia deligens TaxID=321325 RepID=A0ABW3GC84_9NOCA|nr:TVP38/TMEM64 family protein [Williamsia deligens]MCP2195257.1 putative membrane protein YdjX, TVP38/TMEM64 family, SNARE-associated domain [Williamsia deligens]
MVNGIRRWWKPAALAIAFIAILVVVGIVGLPGVDRFRAWSDSAGPWFVVAFFLAYAVICVAPIPRTVFTLSSGVLFGPVTGLLVAVGATMIAAVVAFVLVRSAGREAVAPRLTHPAVRAVDRRLARRGWLAVGSLRLIAPAPFSVINYCAALSRVGLLPYTVATAVGILPGTVSVVVLGSVLSGSAHPAGLAISIAGVVLGVVGLVADSMLPVKDDDSTVDSPASRLDPGMTETPAAADKA